MIARLAAEAPVFPGIVGYDETVLPALETASRAGQDVCLLGERGQAKSRLARLLVGLLDEAVPVVAGAELNDDPVAPISPTARATLAALGDATPIDAPSVERPTGPPSNFSTMVRRMTRSMSSSPSASGTSGTAARAGSDSPSCRSGSRRTGRGCCFSRSASTCCSPLWLHQH